MNLTEQEIINYKLFQKVVSDNMDRLSNSADKEAFETGILKIAKTSLTED